jgi:dTDP-glucose 4,6-dehydratase
LKNILVTGGSGFIGANFIRFLFSREEFSGRIINIDALTYAGNSDNLKDIAQQFADRYIFIRQDICDAEAINAIFSNHRIDAVVHFAAESHVDRSIIGPGDFMHTNIVGTYTLLEAARANMEQLDLFHHVSTDEVFGSLGKEGLFTEKTPYRPSSPYSASKAGSDHLVRAYNKTYGMPITISNCSNNYGPYQFPEKLIPLTILKAISGEPIPVYGDGRNVRDWLYVTDHCEAIWLVMQRGRRGETYNIGGDTERENIDVVVQVCDILDELVDKLDRPRRELITFVKDRPGHDRRYAIDFSKLRDELGWTPSESFETGLRKTVQWYLDNTKWVERVQSGEYRDWMKKQYSDQ